MEFKELRSGLSVEGQEIKAYQTHKKSEKYLFLIAGVHGDEVEGVYVLSELFKWLKETQGIDLPIIIIPTLNPDGLRARTRVNAHEVDLNRNLESPSWSPDFKDKKYNPGPNPLSEPENIFLCDLFKKFQPGLILSFHSWKPFLNYDGEAKEICDFLANYNNYEVVENIGKPTPGSLGHFAPEKYNCPVVTFECPTLRASEKTLKEIWQENEQSLKFLLANEILTKYLSS